MGAPLREWVALYARWFTGPCRAAGAIFFRRIEQVAPLHVAHSDLSAKPCGMNPHLRGDGFLATSCGHDILLRLSTRRKACRWGRRPAGRSKPAIEVMAGFRRRRKERGIEGGIEDEEKSRCKARSPVDFTALQIPNRRALCPVLRRKVDGSGRTDRRMFINSMMQYLAPA